MCHPEEVDRKSDFKWGKKGSRGTDEGVQFYESFTYSGVEYFLYDSVYLHVEDEPEPYIGKLVKIWKQPNGQKKVRVVWFFRQIELRKYLKMDAGVPLTNEIFLASGKGEGLCNINHLEVICGKCNVVCISKDKRNPQPSEEEWERADYIFYRTFDVAKLRISDKIAEEIAGINVGYFFNRKKGQELDNVSKLNLTEKQKIPGLLRFGIEVKDGKAICIAGPASKGEKVKRTADRGEHRPFLAEKTIPQPKNSFCKDVGKADRVFTSQDESKVNLNSFRTLEHLGVSQDISIKKNVIISDSTQPSKRPDVLRLVLERKSNVNVVQKLGIGSGGDKGKSCGSEYKRKDVEDLDGQKGKKLCLNEKATKPSDKVHELTDCKALEATQRPVDKSKWFKNYPWEQRLQDAYETEKLVLFENLDPSYTSEEVKDIVWQAFRVECITKVIPRNTFSSPHHGQAFAIFKSKEVAHVVIDELQNRSFMLENGRPLVACFGTLRALDKQPKFIGHLSIDKVVQKQGLEKRKAVSTSHFPQPNTIEYDMTVEWIKLQKQWDLCWKEFHESWRNVRAQGLMMELGCGWLVQELVGLVFLLKSRCLTCLFIHEYQIIQLSMYFIFYAILWFFVI